MKKLIAVLAIVVMSFALAQPALAHVLVMDETNTVGAILHIVPDDDPIAGEAATLYFDMPSRLAQQETNVSLSIKNEAGEVEALKTIKSESLVTATYVFESQGVYEVRYTVQSQGRDYNFIQSQRVSRGAALSPGIATNYPWAQALLVGSVAGLLVTVIVAVNRRHLIAKQSKM